MKSTIKIKDRDDGMRLDAALPQYLKGITRSKIKRLIEQGMVKVGGAVLKASYKIRAKEIVEVEQEEERPPSATPQKIPLDIIYEDADIIVLNKPYNMVVHPAAGNHDGTLVNGLIYHCAEISSAGDALRPGIVHRLDKDTSGVLVVAKDPAAHAELSRQFKDREVKKVYWAIIYGSPKTDTGTFDEEIGRHPTDRKKMSVLTRKGRSSVTHWKVLERFEKKLTLVEIGLETGRTHQIRVHFSSHSMPVLGDATYGGKRVMKRLAGSKCAEAASKADRTMLHAYSIAFTHPRTKEKMKFKAELPEDFKQVLAALRTT